ncbi:MAG: hypothetical protein V8Q57_08235 [Blautia sp.]
MNLITEKFQKQMGTIIAKRLYDTDSCGYDPVICKTNGKTLLLFSYSSAKSVTKMNYQIVTYKDIHQCLERNQTLFCQAGVLTIFLLLPTGTLLFFSLRKIMAPLAKLKDAASCVAQGNYDIKVLKMEIRNWHR